MINLLNSVGLWPALGAFLPLVVALCTKRETKSGVQGVAFAALAAALGAVEGLVHAAQTVPFSFDWKAAALSALSAWVVGQTAHSNLWKATGLSGKLQGFRAAAAKVEAELPAGVKSALLAEVQKLAAAATAQLDSSAKVVAQAAQVVATQAAQPVAPAPAPVAVEPPIVVPSDDDQIVTPL